jgi:hypothetical protein
MAPEPILQSRNVGESPDYLAVQDFVKTAFAVRCNIVKVWRPLPQCLWEALALREDAARSRKRERQAAAFVVAMTLMLVAGVGTIGYRHQTGARMVTYPALGRPVDMAIASATTGWCWAPSVAPAGWVTLPPLVGWAFVRLIWIPVVAAGKTTREATLACARYLSGVYLYVYLMIFVGAILMVLLLRMAPVNTQWLRYALWLFLFGESFFVPGVMWLRLLRHDRSGHVFGPYRRVLAVVYVVMCVLIPGVGMVVSFV